MQSFAFSGEQLCRVLELQILHAIPWLRFGLLLISRRLCLQVFHLVLVSWSSQHGRRTVVCCSQTNYFLAEVTGPLTLVAVDSCQNSKNSGNFLYMQKCRSTLVFTADCIQCEKALLKLASFHKSTPQRRRSHQGLTSLHTLPIAYALILVTSKN